MESRVKSEKICEEIAAISRYCRMDCRHEALFGDHRAHMTQTLWLSDVDFLGKINIIFAS